MSKPDNVRGLGSDNGLVMKLSTSWPESKVNKESSTEKMNEREMREGGRQQQVLSMDGNKNCSFTRFLLEGPSQ